MRFYKCILTNSIFSHPHPNSHHIECNLMDFHEDVKRTILNYRNGFTLFVPPPPLLPFSLLHKTWTTTAILGFRTCPCYEWEACMVQQSFSLWRPGSFNATGTSSLRCLAGIWRAWSVPILLFSHMLVILWSLCDEVLPWQSGSGEMCKSTWAGTLISCTLEHVKLMWPKYWLHLSSFTFYKLLVYDRIWMIIT